MLRNSTSWNVSRNCDKGRRSARNARNTTRAARKQTLVSYIPKEPPPRSRGRYKDPKLKCCLSTQIQEQTPYTESTSSRTKQTNTSPHRTNQTHVPPPHIPRVFPLLPHRHPHASLLPRGAGLHLQRRNTLLPHVVRAVRAVHDGEVPGGAGGLGGAGEGAGVESGERDEVCWWLSWM